MKIYIDPGHGGSDPGAVGFGTKEAPIALAVAQDLRDELLRQGFVVLMSRESDIDKTLAQRTAEANFMEADIVVSIHCNAYADTSANGTETFIYKKGGQAEKIAAKVHPLLIEAISTKDRGIKEGNLHIIRETDAPAILCELAFITNAADHEKLTDAARQKAAAKAICCGICAHLGVVYQEEVNILDRFKDKDQIPAWALSEQIAEKAVAAGIMKGDEDGNLRPNDPITRIEAAAMIVRAKGL